MKNRRTSRKRADFENRIRVLREELNSAMEGRQLSDDFRSKLKDLRDEENRLLEGAIEEYRRIRLRSGKQPYEIETLVKDINLMEDMGVLNMDEKIVFADMIKEQDYSLEEKFRNISGITAVSESGENSYTCGLSDGNVIFLDTSSEKVAVKDIIKAMPATVLSITGIERRFMNYRDDLLLVTGEDGYVSIVLKEKELVKQWKLCDQSMYMAASSYGTALVVSEEGDIYYMEENGKTWELLSKPLIEKYPVERIAALKRHSYLILSAEGKLERLTINRIEDAEQLWEEPLF